jgi:hypothetical protein
MFTHLLNPGLMTVETVSTDTRMVSAMLVAGIAAVAVFVVARVVMTVVARIVEVIMTIGMKIMFVFFLGTVVMAPVMIKSLGDFFAL